MRDLLCVSCLFSFSFLWFSNLSRLTGLPAEGYYFVALCAVQILDAGPYHTVGNPIGHRCGRRIQATPNDEQQSWHPRFLEQDAGKFFLLM